MERKKMLEKIINFIMKLDVVRYFIDGSYHIEKSLHFHEQAKVQAQKGIEMNTKASIKAEQKLEEKRAKLVATEAKTAEVKALIEKKNARAQRYVDRLDELLGEDEKPAVEVRNF